MKTSLLLIRHGQTDWNVAGRWQGFTDIPLNETGRMQAQALAHRLAHWPLTVLYSSNLARAAETARIISTAIDLEPRLDSVWRERHLGVYEGLTSAEITAQYPSAPLPSNGFVEPPDGESYETFHQRLLNGYQAVLTQHRGENVAIVSHGGAMRILISHVLGLPQRLYAPFSLRGNTGLSHIVIDQENRAQLTLLNDTGHLESFGV